MRNHHNVGTEPLRGVTDAMPNGGRRLLGVLLYELNLRRVPQLIRRGTRWLVCIASMNANSVSHTS